MVVEVGDLADRLLTVPLHPLEMATSAGGATSSDGPGQGETNGGGLLVTLTNYEPAISALLDEVVEPKRPKGPMEAMARTTGKNSGRHPAMTAFTATCLTV